MLWCFCSNLVLQSILELFCSLNSPIVFSFNYLYTFVCGYILSHDMVHVPFWQISDQTTSCGQPEKCELGSFIYLWSLCLCLVTFCTLPIELQPVAFQFSNPWGTTSRPRRHELTARYVSKVSGSTVPYKVLKDNISSLNNMVDNTVAERGELKRFVCPNLSWN